MNRRTVLRAAGTFGAIGVAGCIAQGGPSSGASVDPPSIVEESTLTILDESRDGDTEGPPEIECVSDDMIRIRGYILMSISDRLDFGSMSYKDNIFEVVIAVIEQEGGDVGVRPVYEAEITFSTMPPRIRATEKRDPLGETYQTVSQEKRCN